MPRLSTHQSLQDARFSTLTYPTTVNTANATDANQTYTAAQVLGGMISRTIGAARTDTLPTAAALVEAIQGCFVGLSFEFFVRNTGGFTLTVAVGAGGTADPISTLTVTSGNTRTLKMIFNNVNVGSEAYTLYSCGSAAT